ncbi:ImmA/IrrE family metallo-endopeptidase [Duganella rhizosphaerae]|uniref:ImmA/IrrE family metallo-endopeptidase n=1 Tax=Duganella rhizosphaerae TaxID=2885763 RepID=UPI00403F8FAF
MTQALINPALMTWSRRRAGLTQAELAASIPVKEEKVLAWETGESRPTFRQAQQWADRAHIPFGFLFLKAPPQEVLPLPDLRTVGSDTPESPSVDLLDMVRDVLRKQAWYLDYLAEQEREALPFVGGFSSADAIDDVVADIRRVLGVQAPLKKGGDEYMRQLVAGADAAGILVMRSGIVGSNTHRKLDVGEFRGFAISDRYAPVVFINLADAPAARLFTLIHELAHIWIGSSGISSVSPADNRKIETFCNAVAGEFLVPELLFRERWKHAVDWIAQLPELAAGFHVSKLVIARRACDLGFISRDAYVAFYLAELKAYRDQKGGGGNFYQSAEGKNSKRFSRAVLSEALSGRLLLREAGKLLGVQPAKVRTYAEKTDE